MAYIEGFRGIRYSLVNGKDVSDHLAPPYDTILTPEAKKRLVERSAHNIVLIDLPHVPPKTAGPEYLYRQAGELLRTWMAQRVLCREDEPAIYLYRQSFKHGGKNYIRRGFTAQLRLEEFGAGQVLPHEQTYSGPKEDRLLLSRHTQTYTSQIFCLYEDFDNEIVKTLYTKAHAEPSYVGVLDGVTNEVWVLTERQLRYWLAEKMESRPVFIADGHHRYSTALMYRDELARSGALYPSHPANAVACMFVSMSEPGLLVLPTHRAITPMRALSLDDLAEAVAQTYHRRWVMRTDDPGDIERAVNQTGGQVFGFIRGAEDRCLIVWPKDPEHLLDDLADEYTLSWRTLGVAILHNHMLERIVYPKWLEQAEPKIEYFHLAHEISEFVEGHRDALGVIVPPTPIDSVRQVCSDGMLMPQKSTFFYPKVPTGLVIYPIFD